MTEPGFRISEERDHTGHLREQQLRQGVSFLNSQFWLFLYLENSVVHLVLFGFDYRPCPVSENYN